MPFSIISERVISRIYDTFSICLFVVDLNIRSGYTKSGTKNLFFEFGNISLPCFGHFVQAKISRMSYIVLARNHLFWLYNDLEFE